MKDLWDDGSLPLILLLGIIIAFLGIFPLPESVTSSLEVVQRAQEDRSPLVVADNLVSVVEEQPWRKGLWESAGHAALTAGEAETAGEYFSRAAARGELSPIGYLAWGDADWQAGKPQTALQIWALSGRQGVAADEILPRQAEVYRAVGDDEALFDTLKAILQHLPADSNQTPVVAAIYHELGLLLAAHDPASAPAYLLQAIEYDPTLESQLRPLSFAIQRELSQNDPIYLLVVAGRALANLNRWDLAEKAFANATRLHPEYAEAWAYLGEAQQHLGRSDHSILAALRRALNLDPQSLAANTFMALYWQRREDPEKALKYLQIAAEQDPDNPALLVEIGDLMALLGDLAAGREFYFEAMALAPNDPRYVREFLKFSIRYNLSLREVALPVARQLMITNPDDPASLDIMGEVLFHLGDSLNAERFYLRALEQDPSYDQAHLHLAGLYLLQGERSLAESYYSRVLELSTNSRTRSSAQEALEKYFLPKTYTQDTP